jgi:hypothetical protein
MPLEMQFYSDPDLFARMSSTLLPCRDGGIAERDHIPPSWCTRLAGGAALRIE